MKIKTWDGHAINDGTSYVSTLLTNAYHLAQVSPVAIERNSAYPLVGGIRRPARQLDIQIYIKGSSRHTLIDQLGAWFKAGSEAPVKLVVTDDDGTTNERYIYAVCQALENAGAIQKRLYHATIIISGDVLWRAETDDTDTWAITASGQTKALTNGGQADAYPILQIKPTAAKAGGFLYRRFVSIRWRSDSGAIMYPVDICDNTFDTAALVTGGKMQADGDDLRVYLDGDEAFRWLQDIDTATTQVWISPNWAGKAEFTLKTAIANTGAITEIDIVEGPARGALPDAGIVVINSEIFTYTGVVIDANYANSISQLTGVTRAAHGTSMAAHSPADVVWWCQHEIYIAYGDASLGAPASNDNAGKPIFKLSSTNVSWDYDDFGVTGENRAGAWIFQSGGPRSYTANQGTGAATWAELGIYSTAFIGGSLREASWALYNPCIITAANFANGEIRIEALNTYGGTDYSTATIEEYYDGTGGSAWNVAATVTNPVSAATWTAWSSNPTIHSLTSGVRLKATTRLYDPTSTIQWYVEAADVTLTLSGTYTPAIVIGGEQSTYQLAARITNNTTGDAFDLAFRMSGGQELEVDTNGKTVIYLADNTNQFQALSLVGSLRADWLRLAVGSNTLKFDETGAAGVTIDFSWEERYYH